MTQENKKQGLIDRLKKQLGWKHLIGTLLGLAGGYIYYRTVGCAGGACPLQSNPWLMSIWGAVMGYLLADLIPRRKKIAEDRKEEEQG